MSESADILNKHTRKFDHSFLNNFSLDLEYQPLIIHHQAMTERLLTKNVDYFIINILKTPKDDGKFSKYISRWFGMSLGNIHVV